MGVRYDKQLNSMLSISVKNYNAKIKRLTATGQKFLPEETSVKEIKEYYDNRRDVMRRIKQLKKFSEQGQEKVIKVDNRYMTKFQFDVLKADRALAIKRTRKEMERFGNVIPTSSGVRQGFSYAYMQHPHYISLKHKLDVLSDISNLKDSSQHYKIEALITASIEGKDRKNRQFKEYFTRNLKNLSGLYGDYKREEVDKIINEIDNMSINTFMNIYESEAIFKNLGDEYAGAENPVRDSDFTKGHIGRLVDNIDTILKEYKTNAVIKSEE